MMSRETLFALAGMLVFLVLAIGFIFRPSPIDAAGICDDAIVGVPPELHAQYLDDCWAEVMDR